MEVDLKPTYFYLFLNFIFKIQFLSTWTCKYMYTPGIHTDLKLIYADYAMVYKVEEEEEEESQTNRKTK